MVTSDVINLTIAMLALICGVLMFWSLPVPKSKFRGYTDIPFVSVIIPARNESGRITPLLQSLQEQKFRSFEVLVVDDHSTDRTASVAKAHDAVVLLNEAEGLGHGKSASCWCGAQQAKGKWLLFLDADTYFTNPDAMENLLNDYQRNGAKGILSLQPYHTIGHVYENLSAVFNVIVVVGMNLFTIWGFRFKTAGSFGPCILCSREDYFLSGGHKKIDGAIMDDLALGQAFLDSDLPVQCLGGKGVISFRMYPDGIKNLVEGWCKSFAIASKSTHPAIMTMIIIWISGSFIVMGACISSIRSLAPLDLIVSWGMYTLYAAQTAWSSRRCGDFKWYSFLLYPLLFLFFTVIFAYSLFRVNVLRSVTWKGRKINV